MTFGEGWNVDDGFLKKITEEGGTATKEELCDYDIRDFGLPSLNDVDKRKETGYFLGPIVLQIARYRNVSHPKIQEGKGNSDGVVRLFLTDGHSTISAVLLDNIKGITVDCPPGSKLLLTGKIPLESGFLMLNNSNTRLLGGKVEALIEKWIIEKNSSGVAGAGGRKNDNPAPKWVSFGKKGSQITSTVATKGFKANDVIHAATRKETTDSDDTFEQNRKENIEALDVTGAKKFAVPVNVVVPPKPIPAVKNYEKQRAAAESDRGHDRRKGKGRRGKGSDDEDVPAEFARPSKPSTLFDFLATGGPQDLMQAAVKAPVISQRAEEQRSYGRSGYNDQRGPKTGGSRGGYERNERTQSSREDKQFGRNDRQQQGRRDGGGGGVQKPQRPQGGPPEHYRLERPQTHGSTQPQSARNYNERQNDQSRGNERGYKTERQDNQSYGGGASKPQRPQAGPPQHQQFERRDNQNQPTRRDARFDGRNHGGSGAVQEGQRMGYRDGNTSMQRVFTPSNNRDGGGGGGRFQAEHHKPRGPPAYLTNNDFPTMEVAANELAAMSLSGQGTGPGARKPFFDRPGKTTKETPKWKKGDQCKAPWQDGAFYLATLLHVGPGDMCTLRYDEYGDVQQLPQAVLLVL